MFSKPVKSTSKQVIAVNLPPIVVQKKTNSTHNRPLKHTAWHSITIRQGDSLTKIFTNKNVPYTDIQSLLKLKLKTLSTLTPNTKIRYLIDRNHHITALKYAMNPVTDVLVLRRFNHYIYKKINKTQTEVLSFKLLTIHHSLQRTILDAGLSYQIFQDVKRSFEGTLNLNRDIRPSATIALLYQEFYVEGKPYRTGHIVASELKNHKKSYRVVRYSYPKHHTGYFTPDGHGVESLFLSRPLHYKRVSSRFSYHRMDPILHKFHPHLGVDLAAKRGTPVRSIGNGRIEFIGKDGGYGNAIKIRYGHHYQALYAHMARFAKHRHLHEYVHKGEIIGYVGSTGWSTGPHLHFGFFVNDIPRNWLAFKRPKTPALPRSVHKRFIQYNKRLFAALTLYQDTLLAANTKSDKQLIPSG